MKEKNYEVYKFENEDGAVRYVYGRPEQREASKKHREKRIAYFKEMGYELVLYFKCDAETYYNYRLNRIMTDIISASEDIDKAETLYNKELLSLRNFYKLKTDNVKRIRRKEEQFKFMVSLMIDKDIELSEQVTIFYNHSIRK